VNLSQPKSHSEEAARTAAVVNEVTKQSHALLEMHPLNAERRVGEGSLRPILYSCVALEALQRFPASHPSMA